MTSRAPSALPSLSQGPLIIKDTYFHLAMSPIPSPEHCSKDDLSGAGI